jgi:hypothetical protein
VIPLLLVGVAIASSVYILFWVYIGWRVRIPAEPAVERVDSIDSNEIQAYFHGVEEALPEFASIGTFVKGLREPVTEYIRVLDHPVTGDLATAWVSQTSGGAYLHQEYHLEFLSLFADGMALCTTNAQPMSLLRREPRSQRVLVPAMADPPTLWRIHTAMAAGHARTPERGTPWRPDYPAWLKTHIKEDCQRHIRQGYLRFDTGSAKLRLTWKCILFSTLMVMWPTARIRRAYYQWQANRLLKRLGLPKKYAKAERAKLPNPQPLRRPTPQSLTTLFCPRCDYNLTGVSANRCPECGEAFDAVKLSEAMAQSPQPLTFRQFLALLWAPLAPTIWVLAIALMSRYLAGVFSTFREQILFLGMLAVIFLSVVMIKQSYAWSRELAVRLAVTRALFGGSDRSGLKDSAFIALVWTGFFMLDCLVMLVIAGGLLLLWLWRP